MRLLHAGVAFVFATVCLADTVTLKSGRVINGTYLGGDARTLRVDVGDRIETLDVSSVSKIEFGSPPRSVTARRADSEDAENTRPVLRRSESTRAENPGILRPDTSTPAPPPPAAASRAAVELPAGTNVVIRMIQGVDSEVNRVGETFQASIDEPVVHNGVTLVPRGADVVVKLVDAKESGKLTGRSELTLDLVSVKVDGKVVDLNTQTVAQQSDSRGERTAKVAGGTAAVGAIIGAIAGGGKGAAIGAAAGGAAGAGAQVITKGQRVKIPSETRLTFVLDTPVKI
jgi:hypothetical protein